MENQTVYIEVRPGTGGQEATIWAASLLRMYARFAARSGWPAAPVETGVIKVTGAGAFEKLRSEAGVHRVQRIPKTEKRGRIHTSTATVAILPEIPEKDVVINPNDLQWQFFRASTQGGQNVQKVSTAVRLAHKPTGIVVSAQQERFQEQNRKIALSLLRAKLFEREEEEKMKTIAGYRSAIGRGMRAEKIRTYNFPQDRVTDHRIEKSWGNLEAVLDGELDRIVGATP